MLVLVRLEQSEQELSQHILQESNYSSSTRCSFKRKARS